MYSITRPLNSLKKTRTVVKSQRRVSNPINHHPLLIAFQTLAARLFDLQLRN
jgi:hypothetical protein